MSGWWDRRSTTLGERFGSVAMAMVLAALIVLGVLAVLVVTIRGARATFSTASTNVSVARVADAALNAIAALQEEQALASVMDDPDFEAHAARFTAEAQPATDDAMRALRVAWSTQRARIPETATPPISDVLVAEASLRQFREAAESPSGESTFPLYSEMLTQAIAATGELVKLGTDPVTARDRTLIVSLLTAIENLNTQRYLVQEAITGAMPISEELLLQLDVLNDAADQALFQARSAAEGDDLGVVESIRTGAVADAVDDEIATLTDRSATGTVTSLQWFEMSSSRIDQVNALMPQIHDRIEVEAQQDLVRAERALWSRSILLGALFVVTVLVAGNAVIATRERGQALAEYEQLTEGLRQWFVAAAFPNRDEVDIAARYIPASIRTRSGGDWYDVYAVGELLAVVIGDVAGHGAEATAQMAQLRNILRGQSSARTLEPAAQIDLLDETITESGILATLTYGLLDLGTGDFVYTRAGHTPLLIRSSTGEVRIEEEASGPPVGGSVDLERETAVTRLLPGDTLILITDGVVEGVDRDIDVALDKISKALTEAEPGNNAILDLLFTLNEEAYIDDAAALLITWAPERTGRVV